jgi:hypothetical protein
MLDRRHVTGASRTAYLIGFVSGATACLRELLRSSAVAVAQPDVVDAMLTDLAADLDTL